ncbi:hypothetical protein [Pyxidicoccus caerfyrddinensis]|uniref:hypothetical protein n=1 Tax=Pyxidicoccus caerfyrddinensis TaxID=2709663 RepID=UPI0013D9C009|nr:hypothetical protein [Pyxidicoccus caerfyrddinensis]
MTPAFKPAVAVDYEFTPEEKQRFTEALSSIPANPYTAFPAFQLAVRQLIAQERVPHSFVDVCRKARARDLVAHPFHFLTNCPIDEGVPPFDFERPVQSKYELKKTFIGEGFLITYAELMGTPSIGYTNVNAGDIVHDIYPQKALYKSQSQKTLLPIGFHKDLANHFVRPDFVNILGMRSHAENEILTTFVRNSDLLQYLGPDIERILREPNFYTPYDDLTTYNDKDARLGDAAMHPVVQGKVDFVYFENRTIAYSDEGKAAIVKLNEALHALKGRVLMRPGDFVSSSNNTGLHGKDVGEIRDAYQHKIRWSIKTVNVSDLEQHRQHYKEYVPGHYAVVNG